MIVGGMVFCSLKKDVLPKKGRKTSMCPSLQMEADDDVFEQKSSGISLFSNILKAPFRHFPGSTANCVFCILE